MLEKGVIFLVIFFAALLQLSLFSNLFFLGVSPNLMLILVIFWTVHEGFEGAFFKIIFVGFMLDLFSFQPIGTNIFILTAIAFFADSFIKRFLVAAKNWRTAILIFLITASTLICELVLYALSKAGGYFKLAEIDNIIFTLNDAVLAKKILVNVLFFFLISFPLIKIEQFLNLRKNRKNLNYV
ncbi:MAG: rod shape-determining protein MreD [Candidatus Moraniibacteriota bacterium]